MIDDYDDGLEPQFEEINPLIVATSFTGTVLDVKKAERPCGRECPRNKGEAHIYVRRDNGLTTRVSVCLGKEDVDVAYLEQIIGANVAVEIKEGFRDGDLYTAYSLKPLSGPLVDREFQYETK